MKDDLKYRFLKRLAETLDIAETMKEFPEVSKSNIHSLFLKLANAFHPPKEEAKKVNIFVDGASRGNPGNAGIGVFITTQEGKVLKAFGKYLGKTTNNVAEYNALVAALEEAFAMGATDIKIFADSELMVKQITGAYKVKNAGLLPLFKEAKTLLMKFNRYDIIHINREKNIEADRLANQAIDLKAR